MAQKEYEQAGGKAHEAQYASSNYVCKNYTVYLFRANAGTFRMAEFPNVPLKIPDNKPREECTDYVYGVEWKDVPASEGNPFYAAASFRYDPSLSAEENRQEARAFLQQVQQGRLFPDGRQLLLRRGRAQHDLHCGLRPGHGHRHAGCDSNMKGEKRNGIRYGYLQFDAVKKIDWFVDAFCRKKYGATIYRLRDDIIRVAQ